jgi:DNA modification methylase
MIDLRQGDCLEVLKTIPNESIDLIVTSPPYDDLRNYNNTLNWNYEVFKKIANAIYSFTSTINTHTQKRVKEILNSTPTERDRLINIIRNALLTDEELDLSAMEEENITLYFPEPNKGQLSIDDPER